jgi:hypothetical protein
MTPDALGTLFPIDHGHVVLTYANLPGNSGAMMSDVLAVQTLRENTRHDQAIRSAALNPQRDLIGRNLLLSGSSRIFHRFLQGASMQ